MVVKRATQGIGSVAAFAGLALLVALTGSRLDRVTQADALDQAPVYLPKAAYLQPIALGWRNVLADAIWFRTISYFGQHYRTNRTYPWLATMCDLVTDLDPRAFHVYRFAGAILPWEAHQVDAGMRLLEKGVTQFPDSWVLHYFLGFNAFFFQNDNARALAELRTAAALPDAHPSIARLTAVLAAQQYGPEATLAFLSEMQRDVDSNDIRQVLAEQMQEAQVAADLERLDAAANLYRARQGAPAQTPQVLVQAGLLEAVPSDPFGGHYEFDPASGAARSSTGRTPSKLHQSKVRERVLQGESAR